VVPFVERQEFVNVGVILHCKKCGFLKAKLDLELERVYQLQPKVNLAMIQNQLETIMKICAGGPETGIFATWSTSERFDWLVSPSSTVVQTSPTHAGVCENAGDELENLYKLMVGPNDS
jgi:hypothetical protein